MERFRGELVFKALGVFYRSTVGSRATKKKKKVHLAGDAEGRVQRQEVPVSGFRIQHSEGSTSFPARCYPPKIKITPR